MAEGIEATLARAAHLADMVLSMGCPDSAHALADHACPIDEATDMLMAIIECRKELGSWPGCLDRVILRLRLSRYGVTIVAHKG